MTDQLRERGEQKDPAIRPRRIAERRIPGEEHRQQQGNCRNAIDEEDIGDERQLCPQLTPDDEITRDRPRADQGKEVSPYGATVQDLTQVRAAQSTVPGARI